MNSPDYLRELLQMLDLKTSEMIQARDEMDAKENAFKISKSKYIASVEQKKTINEKIMAEKAFMREGR